MATQQKLLSKDLAKWYRLQAACRRNPADTKAHDALTKFADESQARYQLRQANCPRAQMDADLPVATHAEQLIELIQKNQVIIVAGETGSGKTTQLPKICLAAGRGIAGMIGCTQPRRIAARAVAKRVADELQSSVGAAVGYQVRFNEQVGEQTYIKFMTDGILLSEIQSDSWLSQYDTLIIDEAHERSLNIDFLLGYLKILLQKRRDLKVIITSATIDTERFSRHFMNAPVLSIEGRGFPVDVLYRDYLQKETPEIHGKNNASLNEEKDLSVSDKIVRCVDEITLNDGLGDILIFLPGEREIRETHLALSKRKYRATDVLPLYARLSVKDQDRVFQPEAGRRIVLATNVAETSLTVPRIRYVIDPGIARIKRYSARQKMDRLQLEAISQASANQRKGRCGRISAGVCYRLYSESDFLQRPEFTDPEIKRASLAGVILRMLSLNLGALENFPFVEMPDSRSISDGWQTLAELSAIDAKKQLSAIGRFMARLPIDVKLSRMLVAANTHGVMQELVIIAAFMGIQDPRERPADAKQLADDAHRAFADPQSEFITLINLWRAYKMAHEEFSQSQLRRWCDKNFLSYLRMREWRELHRQLLLSCQALDWNTSSWHEMETRFEQNKSNDKLAQQHYQQIHRAILTGLPTQIGHKNEKAAYDAPRQRRFHLFPGSSLAKQLPNWCMVGNLLETQRVWGMMAAKFEPDWLLEECPNLLSRHYFDPHWSRKQGRVVGYCQISFFGLLLVAKKPIHYGGLFPNEAREIFIQQALVSGEINTRTGFIAQNIKTLQTALGEEAKQRRSGLLVDEHWQARWYSDRIPSDINNAETLDKWVRSLNETQKNALLWKASDLLLGEQSETELFPNYYALGNNRLALHYCFKPGDAHDGVTLDVPVHLLNAIDEARTSWLVPGLLAEKATALIRGLPKSLRRNFVPAPDFARAFAQAYVNADADQMQGCLARFLHTSTGVEISALDFQGIDIDAYLSMQFRLLDKHLSILSETRNLAQLKTQFSALSNSAFTEQAGQLFTQQAIHTLPEQAIPECIESEEGLLVYPALVFIDDEIHLQAHAELSEAQENHRAAIQFLLKKQLQEKCKSAAKQLPINPKLGLVYASIESAEKLRSDCVHAALHELLIMDLAHIRNKSDFDTLHKQLSQQLFARCILVLTQLEESLKWVAQIRVNLHQPLMGWAAGNLADIKKHLDRLVYPGFLTRTPGAMLAHLPRYLKALSVRLDRALQDPLKDQTRMLEIQIFVLALTTQREKNTALNEAWQRYWYEVEELCVQTFAQELSVKGAVSIKRLTKQLAQLT